MKTTLRIRKHTIRLQTSIGALVVLLVAGLSGLLLYLEYREGRAIAVEYAKARFLQAGLMTRDQLRLVLAPTRQLLQGIALNMESTVSESGTGQAMHRTLLTALAHNPQVSRLVLAARDDGFILAENLTPGDAAYPAQARFALHTRRIGLLGPLENRQFFDGDAEPLGSPEPSESEWHFQQEDWFRAAVDSGGLVAGNPEPIPDASGLASVIAWPDPSGFHVLAAYITVQDLDDTLAAHRLTPGTLHVLANSRGTVLASSVETIRPGTVAAQATTRPLLAIADLLVAQRLPESEVMLDVEGETWLAWVFPVTTPFSSPVRLAVLTPEEEVLEDVLARLQRNIALSLAASLLGLLLAVYVGRAISSPIQRLTREAARLEKLDMAADFHLHSRITEVQHLSSTLRLSAAALTGFARYVPDALVRRIVSGEIKPELGGERRQVTLFFSDIEGFTTVSEPLEPEAVTQALTEYLSRIGTVLSDGGATIDKYMGDAVMAFWNAPSEQPDHARLACLAALKAEAASRALEGEAAARGLPVFPTRFGLHLGEAVIGNIGSADRMSYTALGSAVNIASRIEGLNKYFGTSLLISEQLRQAAGAGFVTRPAGLVIVKGAAAPVLVHALMGTDGIEAATDLPPERIAMAKAWQAPFDAYQTGNWDLAVQRIESYLAGHGPDTLALTTLDHAIAHRNTPPAEWDGVERMTEK